MIANASSYDCGGGPFNKTTIAVANKLARIVWAVWARDVPFRAMPVAA